MRDFLLRHIHVMAVIILMHLCSAVVPARAEEAAVQESERTTLQQENSPSPNTSACSANRMKPVSAPHRAGEICEPQGETVLSRITSCLSTGMEAVLVPDGIGVVCARPAKGGIYLDTVVVQLPSTDGEYPHPHMIDSEAICAEEHRKPGTDKRVLSSRIIKELVRNSISVIDSIGIRIIGGIFCDGLDLTGLNIPFSLVLDRSIFMGGEDSRVDIRNFRTKGDLSVDNAIVYTSLRIDRADISGSIYATYAFMRRLKIADTTVKGSIRLNNSIITNQLTVENVSVAGDLDVSASFISTLEVLKDKIGGVFDLSQSQARCSYDIRKNEIGDMVAVQLGFGAAESSTTNATSTIYNFKPIWNNEGFGRSKRPDAYERYMQSDLKFGTGAMIRAAKECANDRLIKPGTFVLVDNHIKSSLCLRSFNWLTGPDNKIWRSNIYFNEDLIGGATWLDIARPLSSNFMKSERGDLNSSEPLLSIFNVRTGTLVLNFDVTAQDVSLTVNGLHFERIYTSKAVCESALSLRSAKPKKPWAHGSNNEGDFPPNLELPKTEQIIDWINKNKFAGTQQPFAEFVAVFERAGDSEGAKELKIRAANAALMSSLCNLLPSSWRNGTSPCKSEGASSSRDERPASTSSMISDGFRWVEKTAVAILDLMLWILADHGYRPERIGWFVIGAIVLFFVIFLFWLRIVGYSVESNPDKIKPIGLVFLFDRLLPAYRVKEENYKIARYYVLPKKADHRPNAKFRYLGREWLVAEATDRENERAERYLDVLRFLGLVFTIFIIAAIGRLVR